MAARPAHRRVRADLPGAGLRAPARRRPPRHQAGERAARRLRRGLPGRLGQREAALEGGGERADLRRPGRAGLRPEAARGARERALGHARLHRARADPRDHARIDHRADIFALGVVLYEIYRRAPVRRADRPRRDPRDADARPQAAALDRAELPAAARGPLPGDAREGSRSAAADRRRASRRRRRRSSRAPRSGCAAARRPSSSASSPRPRSSATGGSTASASGSSRRRGGCSRT